MKNKNPAVKISKKRLLTVIILALIIILSTIGVFTYQNFQLKRNLKIQADLKNEKTNTNNEQNGELSSEASNKDWETYISPDNSFSFQYPKTWKLNEGSNWVSAGCSAYGGETQPGKPCDPNYNLGSFNITKVVYTSLDDETKSLSKRGYSSDKENIFFQGREGIKTFYPGSSQSGGSYLMIIIKHKNNVYELTSIYRKIFNAKQFSDFEDPNPDILSTFRFLP